MSPVTCPCGTPVAPDNAEHATVLDASEATLLCPECDQADIDARTATVAANDARLTAERKATARELMRRAGVPPRHLESAFGFTPKDPQREADAASKAWARDGGMLVLAGTMGTGKTTLAARSALRAIVHGRPVTWRTTAAVVSGLWANDQDARNQAEQLLYNGTGALVLDDLDVAKTTPAALETLGALVDRWYAAQQPLLVTTNALAPSDLEDRYGLAGQRIVSRLLSDDHWLNVAGPDLRTTTTGA